MKLLPRVDALIFDIDGVIMDVSQSFPVVVCETVGYYLQHILEWPLVDRAIKPEEVELFKRAGGFNSDEDLTHAVLLLFLSKSIVKGSTDAAILRESAPTLKEFAGDIAHKGGGLQVAETLIHETLPPDERRALSGQVNPRLILQLFREIYGGTVWCEKLYGFTPEYVKGDGYVEKEEVLLDTSLLPGRSMPLAVLSGRTLEETQLALERLDLETVIPPKYRLTVSDGYRKPDPRMLRALRERMRFRRAVYVGDSLDDLRTVTGYRDLPASAGSPVHSCQVLSGYGGEGSQRLFVENGAEIVAPNLNSFLAYFRGVARKK